jgi:hypothetical protein
MNRTRSSIWGLSILVFALGYVFVDRPLADRLSQIEADRDRTLAAIDRNAALAHDAAALGNQLAALRARLAEVDLSADPDRSLAAFVGAATAIARACRVRITGLDGRPIARRATIAPTRGNGVPPAFSATTIEVTLQGTYANLIAALRRLSHGRVPLQVEVSAIGRTADPSGTSEPLLDARIRVDLLHRATPKVADASAA